MVVIATTFITRLLLPFVSLLGSADSLAGFWCWAVQISLLASVVGQSQCLFCLCCWAVRIRLLACHELDSRIAESRIGHGLRASHAE